MNRSSNGGRNSIEGDFGRGQPEGTEDEYQAGRPRSGSAGRRGAGRSPRPAALTPGRGGVKMRFDSTQAHPENPNAQKSLRVIDARMIEEKARLTKAKKKLERRFEKNFNKWREYDLLTCLIAIVGLALSIVDWEYLRVSTDKIIEGQLHDCDGDGFRTAKCQRQIRDTRVLLCESNFLRVIILLVSLFGVVTLWVRHVAKARWLNEDLPLELLKSPYVLGGSAREVIEAQGYKRRSWFQTSFWLEALIFLVCPLPFFEKAFAFEYIDISAGKTGRLKIYYLLSDFILVVMFLRVYFVVRAVFNYNMYMDSFAKKLCRSYGFTANVRFTFKALLLTDPARTVSVLMVGSVVILAYQLRIFEIQYYKAIGQLDFDNYFSSVWCVIITMTTVGYGDMYPVTEFGRIIGVIAAFWGTFVISLLIIVAAEVFSLNLIERKALHHLLQTRKAAQTITNSMKYFISKQRYLESIHDAELDDQGGDAGKGGATDASVDRRPSIESDYTERYAGKAEPDGERASRTSTFQDDLLNFDDGVELSDVTSSYKQMLGSLHDFNEQKQMLDALKIGDDSQKENLQLVKMQVLDMAERFDLIEETQRTQSIMLSFLVQAHSREQPAGPVPESGAAARGASVPGPAVSMRVSERDYGSLLQRPDSVTDFTLSERETRLPKVEEVEENESQGSAGDQGEDEPRDDAEQQERLEQLQTEIMEAQRHLYRLQAQYNDQLQASGAPVQSNFQNSLAQANGAYQEVPMVVSELER